MFRALFAATLLVTLLVNIVFLLATRERANPLDDAAVATATMAASSGAFAPSASALVDGERHSTGGAARAQPSAARRLFSRSSSTFAQNNGNENAKQQQPPPNIASQRPKQLTPTLPQVKQAPAELLANDGGQQTKAPVENEPKKFAAKRARTRWRRTEHANKQPAASAAAQVAADVDNHLDLDARLDKRAPHNDKHLASSISSAQVAEPLEPLESNHHSTSRKSTQILPHSNKSLEFGEAAAQNSIASARARPTDSAPSWRPARPSRLKVRVKSSKSHVLISVDNAVVHESRGRSGAKEFAASSGQEKENEDEGEGGEEVDSDKARGIHVVVLSQFDGSLMAARTFDTYSAGQDDELHLFLKQLRPGRLVVFAVQDEASFRMAAASPARKLLKSRSWSSRSIGELRWRDMWAFVARPGVERPNLAEALTKSRAFSEWAPNCELAVEFELESEAASSSSRGALQGCATAELEGRRRPAPLEADHLAERRREFCARVEGYGRVCDCQRPAPIEFAAAQLPAGAPISAVPIVVIASNRPYYLYRMLRSLLAATGVQPAMVTVFVDGFYDEPARVAQLFNLRVVQQKPEGRRAARISHHYKSALALTFEKFHPNAKYALIFEEDLDVARDTLVYFDQTIGLLERDPTLYCASAWNDQGYEHAVDGAPGGQHSSLMRIETMPGLGWLLSKRLFIEELEPSWPSFERAHDWDMWIRTPAVRRARECIIPEVSRTYHFGATGTNINAYFQRQYFAKHAFNLMSNVSAAEFASELEHLEHDAYEQFIWRLLASAQTVHRPPPARGNKQTSDEEYLCTFSWLNGPPPPPPLAGGRSFASSNKKANETNSTRSPLKGGSGDEDEDDDDDFDSKVARSKTTNKPARSEQTSIAKSDKSKSDKKTYVIFIKMIDLEAYGNWLRLARCWHLWDLDARGQHKAMWRLHAPTGEQLLVVGSPASPYSKGRPVDDSFDLVGSATTEAPASRGAA